MQGINISSLISDARFLEFILQIDFDLAEAARIKRCPECGGVLHYARYLRKGRLLEHKLPQGWHEFHGLCCSREGCRKRVRPLSTRFAGRSPYGGSVVLLAKLLFSGGSLRSIIAICKELCVSERTVRRWILFWKKVEKNSRWWRKLSFIWSLSGKKLHDLWNNLLIHKKNLRESFKYLLVNSAELWNEIAFFVGDPVPAKDA